MIAYLVIREGSNWTDVYRLIPGQVVTIGRAPTNQVVIKDERCSRFHAEVFLHQERWTLRDHESRNGTTIGSELVQGDATLAPGDIIRIGQSQLAYVHDLATAFPDSSTIVKAPGRASSDTVGSPEEDELHVLSADAEPTTITHRRGQTRFLQPLGEEDAALAIPRVGRAAATLCRLAFTLAQAPNVSELAKAALAGLFEETPVDAGAVLILPRDVGALARSEQLDIIATRTDTGASYQRASEFVVSTVLGEGEAVLARNVTDDSTIGTRDSHGEILATSIMCAPIRHDNRILGLIHLYSTDDAREPDPDDLEFTLAVAETVAVALQNLSRQEELAEDLSQIKSENLQLRERLGVQSEIVGSSLAMDRVSQEVARAAPSRATVLIRGESGVGKELVARAVHFSSPRGKGPFVCLNCAALSETLLESELFGHERGAFTGATDRKVGKFEAADTGTLMLDEIGEMSPTIQAKFLRVLEGHPFERVGGSKPITADVRVIAATNRDLEKDVAAGRFRRDLYFRLHVVEIVVPPLRKRPEDIHELAYYFLERFVSETGRKVSGFTPQAMDRMQQYRWPGNVRELKNVVERAVVLCSGPYIEQDDVLLTQLSTAGDTAPLPRPASRFQPSSLADMEAEHILATLRSTGWNKSQTAQILGIERSTLDRKIRRYDLAEHLPRRGA